MGLRNTYTTLQEEDIAVTLQYHLVQYILKRRSLLTTTGGDQGFFGGLEFANLKTCVYTSLFSRKQGTMVAFGNALLESLRPGWEEAYLDYEGLKELIGSTDTSAFDRRLPQWCGYLSPSEFDGLVAASMTSSGDTPASSSPLVAVE